MITTGNSNASPKAMIIERDERQVLVGGEQRLQLGAAGVEQPAQAPSAGSAVATAPPPRKRRSEATRNGIA